GLDPIDGVPHSCDRTRTARNDTSSVLRKCQCSYVFRSSDRGKEIFSGLCVPGSHEAIKATRDDLPSIEGKSHTPDFSFMAVERKEFGSIRRMPDLPSSIVARGDCFSAVGRKGNGGDWLAVSFEDANYLPCG